MSDKIALQIDAESQTVNGTGEAETYFVDPKIRSLPTSRANLIAQIITPEIMRLFRLSTAELRRRASAAIDPS